MVAVRYVETTKFSEDVALLRVRINGHFDDGPCGATSARRRVKLAISQTLGRRY